MEGGSALRVEYFAQSRVAAPTHWKLRSVRKDREVGVFAVRLYLLQTLEVNDEGAVNAQELRRIERLFQARGRLLFQPTIPFADYRNIVILSFDIVEFVDGNDVNVTAIAQHDPIRKLSRNPSRRCERRRQFLFAA